MFKKITALSLLAFLACSTAFAQAKEQRHPEYGPNIIRFAPLAVLDIGVGVGFSYERFLGKDKMVGVVLPFYLILQNKEDLYGGYPNQDQNYNTYGYFAPGIKIYPFGQRRVTYAIGPNLMLGYGGGKQWSYTNDIHGNTYPSSSYTTTIFRLGILVNNYINFQITPNFNLGLTGGLGIRYIDHQKKEYEMGGSATVNNGFDVTGQFALTLGYRF
jgi:hypothetical protein